LASRPGFMVVHLIRHAHCESTEDADPAISDEGHDQAEALAKWFQMQRGQPKSALRKLLVAPNRRTLGTAEPIHRATGVPAEVVVGLHEVGGVGPSQAHCEAGGKGLGLQEMFCEFPFIWKAQGVKEDGWWKGGLESESTAAARVRKLASLLWEEAKISQEYGAVALLSHGRLLDMLLKQLLGAGGHSGEVMYMHHNTGVTTLALVPRGVDSTPFQTIKAGSSSVLVLGMNAQPHLETLPRPMSMRSQLNVEKAVRFYLVRGVEIPDEPEGAAFQDSLEQVDILANFMMQFHSNAAPHECITKLMSSAERGSLHCGSFIAQALDLNLEVETGLHDLGGLPDGDRGIGKDELHQTFPRAIDAYGQVGPDGWWEGGVESQDAQLNRCRAVVAKMWLMAHEQEHDGAIALIAPGKFIDLLLQELLQVGAGDCAKHQDSRFMQFHTGFHVLDLAPTPPKFGSGVLHGITGVVGTNIVPHFDGLSGRGAGLKSGDEYKTAAFSDTIILANILP